MLIDKIENYKKNINRQKSIFKLNAKKLLKS